VVENEIEAAHHWNQPWPQKHMDIFICSFFLLLMIKFDKAGKIGWSGFLFWIIRFQQFQNMNRTGARLEDLKIKDVLRPRKY
jgi:hypothetical protein